jgi:hypothetical protein
MGIRGFRAFALVATVVAVVLAVTAANAMALATTSKAQWNVGATETSVSPLIGGAPFSVSLAKNPTVGEMFLLETTIGGSTIPVRAEFGKVSCPGCKITNEDPAKPGVAIGTGRLLFSSGRIGPPWNCKIQEGKAETNPLFFEAHYTEGGKWLMRIVPVSGELVMAVVPEGCALAKFPVDGANFGAFISKTGTFGTTQTIEFSPGISASAGSSWQVGTYAQLRSTGTLVMGIEEKEKAPLYFGVK